MSAEQLITEIKEVNLAYLLLAQQMLREDKAAAMYRLGVSKEVAGILGSLTLAQLMKMSASSTLLCRFRFDDNLIFDILTNHSKPQSIAQSHAAILIAGRPVAEVA